MLEPASFATHFARAVDLFRDASAKEDQKAEFRALIDALYEAAATLKADGSRLVVNGTPLDGAAFAPLPQRLELHGVGEIGIPQDPSPSHLFELLRALADQPGADDLPTRLRAIGAEGISVTITRVSPPPPAPLPPAPPPPPPPPRLDARSLGTEGILRGMAMADIPSPAVPVGGGGVPEVSHETPTSEPALAEASAVSAPGAPPAAAKRSIADPLAELERNPRGPQTGELMGALAGQVAAAVKNGPFEQALQLIAGLVRIEQKMPEALRRSYGIAFKRMCPKAVLEGVAHLLVSPGHQPDALLVLQRAGGDAVEVLLELLIAAPTVPERRSIFTALSQMKEGTDQLVHLLGHHQWYVVRNVAELIGELGMEQAVPALTKLLGHMDERVRKAAALALAKIGTPATVEPLRRALRDEAAGVRSQVAMGIGGRRSSALAMPLVVAMEAEKDGEVERELILALGRIGTPDAVQALIKIAQPTGRLFGRKPAALRIAAVEALRLTATPVAVGTLQGMAGDSDREVRAAVQRALAELKRQLQQHLAQQ